MTISIFFLFFFIFIFLLILLILFFFFFFNDTATTEIYTLSLHDALPIAPHALRWERWCRNCPPIHAADRKSTRLNSSHGSISYAVFCLKKKKKKLYPFFYYKKKKKKNKKIITN